MSSADGLRPFSPVRYGRGYLASAWWAEVRRAYELHPYAPHACAVCGALRYELHHRTYERLGREQISDLLALCRAHHEALHGAWRHHHEQRPEDTLAAFTDAWVIIKRRGFRTAPLPSLQLYRSGPRPDGGAGGRHRGDAGRHRSAARAEGLSAR